MIAGDAKHFVARLAQPVEKGAGVLELLGSRALGEVAADDDEIGLELVSLALNRLDQVFVMRAEMQI